MLSRARVRVKARVAKTQKSPVLLIKGETKRTCFPKKETSQRKTITLNKKNDFLIDQFSEKGNNTPHTRARV
jgi:hypothetical protein